MNSEKSPFSAKPSIESDNNFGRDWVLCEPRVGNQPMRRRPRIMNRWSLKNTYFHSRIYTITVALPAKGYFRVSRDGA